jgi:hypothetical protein
LRLLTTLAALLLTLTLPAISAPVRRCHNNTGCRTEEERRNTDDDE